MARSKPARLLYADIGRVIAANGWDSVSRRAYTSRARKLQMIGQALARVVTGPGPSPEPPLRETRFLVDAVSP